MSMTIDILLIYAILSIDMDKKEMKMAPKPTKNSAFKFDEETKKQLAEIARNDDRSMSSMLRQLIREAYEKKFSGRPISMDEAAERG